MPSAHFHPGEKVLKSWSEAAARAAEEELANPKLHRLLSAASSTADGLASMARAVRLQAANAPLAPALDLLRQRRLTNGWAELRELAEASGGKLMSRELEYYQPVGDGPGREILTIGEVLELRLRAAGVLVDDAMRWCEPVRYRLPA